MCAYRGRHHASHCSIASTKRHESRTAPATQEPRRATFLGRNVAGPRDTPIGAHGYNRSEQYEIHYLNTSPNSLAVWEMHKSYKAFLGALACFVLM